MLLLFLSFFLFFFCPAFTRSFAHRPTASSFFINSFPNRPTAPFFFSFFRHGRLVYNEWRTSYPFRGRSDFRSDSSIGYPLYIYIYISFMAADACTPAPCSLGFKSK
uniref:Secreted protein n=1 Tax=Setaria viridis TaxID=4556 RepID=A0A4V6D454_SETVI|nr:hypothetical protein SEVIR_7G158403v2 [Setaria viridis]